MFESRHVGSSVLIRTVLKMVIYPCLLNLVPVVTYETYLSAGIHLKLKLKSQNIVKPVVGVQTLILSETQMHRDRHVPTLFTLYMLLFM